MPLNGRSSSLRLDVGGDGLVPATAGGVVERWIVVALRVGVPAVIVGVFLWRMFARLDLPRADLPDRPRNGDGELVRRLRKPRGDGVGQYIFSEAGYGCTHDCKLLAP
jgi:hypothetical protein